MRLGLPGDLYVLALGGGIDGVLVHFIPPGIRDYQHHLLHGTLIVIQGGARSPEGGVEGEDVPL